MPKSKYPRELDTSVEIPAVRDNILEVGSDSINSLRSAIFNIEKALGINPQGAVGKTVSERLDKSLDKNGNLRPEALSIANVLSGPIIDANVSNVAAIRESKLKLDYPTNLLQSEISVLNQELVTILSQLEELTAELSVHINKNALDRHPGTAISISKITEGASDTSASTFLATNAQELFEEIYSSHINYTGLNISDENNSHNASQIYFDKINVSEVISNSDVQGAIEDLANSSLGSLTSHQDFMHSNGILRMDDIYRPSDISYGDTLAENISVSFSASLGLSSGTTSEIIINDSISLNDFNLQKSDIITISDTSFPEASYNRSYEIESFTLVGDNISSINIYGKFSDSSTAQAVAKITKNTRSETNKNSLLVSAREDASLTSTKTLQLCNPNSTRVISSNINPLEITTSNRYIGIQINSGSIIALDLYSTTATRQTIDSIVSRINEQCAENAYNFLAYRLDYDNLASELVIALNVPDDEDEENIIVITRNIDDGIDAAGFSHIEDLEIKSSYGTSYYILGSEYQGLYTKLDSTNLNFSASSTTINSTSGIDFIEAGVKPLDLITISNSSDDGSYLISDVSSNQITISSSQLPSGFQDSNSEDTRFRIYRNTVSLEDITFSKISSSFGSMLLDVFMDKDREIHLDKRFEYSSIISGTKPLYTVVDFEGEISDKEIILSVSQSLDYITFTLDNGTPCDVWGDDSYIWILSGNNNVKLKIHVPEVARVVNKIISTGGDLSTIFYGFSGVNKDSNLLISRLAFDNFNGRVSGAKDFPRVLSKINFGNIDEKELSTALVKNRLERPINELRGSGVVSGLQISSPSLVSNLFSFNISAGICYVRGKRIEFSQKNLFISDIDSTSVDKIFIAINEDGVLEVRPAVGANCKSPFEPSEYCMLSALEYDGSNILDIDLRLFINNIDFKILNSITVSPQPEMGHFRDLGKALKYAKRFSQTFPRAGIPTVHLKSGIHEKIVEIDSSNKTFLNWFAQSELVRNKQLVDELYLNGLVIDFPVRITGEGDSTELKLRSNYTFSDTTQSFKGMFLIPGAGFTNFTRPLELVESGLISFSDFKMNNSRITIPDLNIENSSSDPLHFSILIDNVTFDHQNFESPNVVDNDFNFASVDLSQSNDNTTNKGNFSMINSRIITGIDKSGSAILIDDPILMKNLIFANNKLIDSDSSSSFFSANIVDFSLSDSGANISLSGNISTGVYSTDNSDRAQMYPASKMWADRINKDLYVGGDISVNGNITGTDISFTGDASFSGDLEAPTFIYSSPLERTKTITFESNLDPGAGNTSPNVVGLSNLNLSGEFLRSLLFTNAGVGSEFAIIRIPLEKDESLTSIGVQYYVNGGTTLGSYTLDIFSRDAFGQKTTLLSPTSMSGGSLITGTVSGTGTAPLAITPIVGQLYYTYWLRIKRTNATGFDNHVFSIRFITEVDSVDSALGAL